jgi:DHA1 family bicyclomycin/chloramphenicol resistance-like MFS transporter
MLILHARGAGRGHGRRRDGARAIIRDLYAPPEGARVMSQGAGGLARGRLPERRSWAVCWRTWFNWRVALATLAVFGAGVAGAAPAAL